MNLSSLLSVKRTTASMRCRGSSTSLMLHARADEQNAGWNGVWITHAANRSGRSRYCQYSRLGMGSSRDAGSDSRLDRQFSYRNFWGALRRKAHMAARSLTPRERFRRPTIILSFPPSPLSGTAAAGASVSRSNTWVDGSSSLGGGRLVVAMMDQGTRGEAGW